jgi:hypothetical protein
LCNITLQEISRNQNLEYLFTKIYVILKVSATSFAVGVVVSFTLKKRLCRWVARLLKKIKDDG